MENSISSLVRDILTDKPKNLTTLYIIQAAKLLDASRGDFSCKEDGGTLSQNS